MVEASPDSRPRPVGEPVGPLETQLRGEVFKTVSGQLLGTYRLDTTLPPPLGELLLAVERRVAVDRERIRHRARAVRVEHWSGGSTSDGRGRWEADIVAQSANGAYKQVGRVRLTVQLLGSAPARTPSVPHRRVG